MDNGASDRRCAETYALQKTEQPMAKKISMAVRVTKWGRSKIRSSDDKIRDHSILKILHHLYKQQSTGGTNQPAATNEVAATGGDKSLQQSTGGGDKNRATTGNDKLLTINRCGKI